MADDIYVVGHAKVETLEKKRIDDIFMAGQKTQIRKHTTPEKVTMQRLNRELRIGKAPMVEARAKALEDDTCDRCAKWELCDNKDSLWAFTLGFGKCRCEKFVDEYLWDAEPPQDGFIILEANCGANGFLMGPKFGCPHFENKEEKE